MRKIAILFSCTLAMMLSTTFTSCQKEGQEKSMTFTANMEGSSSKTAMAYAIAWSTDDQIRVFPQETVAPFTLSAGANTLHGTFSGTATSDAGTYYAVYPYSADYGMSGSTITNVTIPAEQTAVNGGFDPQANVMVAQSSDAGTLNFKNVCAYVRVTTQFVCDYIKVWGRDANNNLLNIAGTVSINYNEGNPTYTITSDGSQSVTLRNGASTIPAGNYIIGVLPNVNVSDLIIEFKPTDSATRYKQITPSSSSWVRGSLIDCGAVSIEESSWGPDPQGTLSGVFSVSESTQVRFSQGNLQYQASTHTWRIAKNQYDVVGSPSLYATTTDQNFVYPGNVSGSDNALISSSYSGWIDMFGWSTSSTYYGTSSSNSNNDYLGSFVDWGTAFGSDSPWRTMNDSEWWYLILSRTNASSKRATGRIQMTDGSYVNGCLFLPDDWNLPAGCSFSAGYGQNTYDYSRNTYTLSQWRAMQGAGAIFLPAAGRRIGTSVDFVGGIGSYWSADLDERTTADYLGLFGGSMSVESTGRSRGQSVRLVQDYDN